MYIMLLTFHTRYIPS